MWSFTSGIAGLGRKFRIIDDDGNRQLNPSEFGKAIHEHALDLSETVRELMDWQPLSLCMKPRLTSSGVVTLLSYEQEIEELFQFVDTDNSGGINFDEFLIAIRVCLISFPPFSLRT